MQKAKIMYKLLNNMGPQSLTNLFTYKSEMTSYNLRNVSTTLCLPQSRTNNLKKSFMYDGWMDHSFGILFLRKLKRANAKLFYIHINPLYSNPMHQSFYPAN